MKLLIKKHFSPDQGLTMYRVYCTDYFPYPDPIWSTDDLEKAKERVDLIKEIGIKSYIERISIKIETVFECDLEPKVKMGRKKEPSNIEYR